MLVEERIVRVESYDLPAHAAEAGSNAGTSAAVSMESQVATAAWRTLLEV